MACEQKSKHGPYTIAYCCLNVFFVYLVGNLECKTMQLFDFQSSNLIEFSLSSNHKPDIEMQIFEPFDECWPTFDFRD